MRNNRFEWDDAKAAGNLRKHRVSFVTACEAFDDPNSLEGPDDDPDEVRWKLTGMTTNGVLVVIHTERGARHRIISARRANGHEQAEYLRQSRP